MKSVVAPAIALATVTACGGEEPTRKARQSPTDVAELVGGAGGPELVTPVAQGRADGVRVRVHNETNREAELDYEVRRGGTGGGGDVAPPGTSDHVIPLAAEAISIGCAPRALDRVVLRVVDPADELVSAEPDCTAYARNPPVPPTTLAGGEPVSVARRFLRGRGLRPTDRVVRAAPIAGEFEAVSVVRNGRVVASVWFDEPSSRHRIGTVQTCTDFRR